MHIHCKYSTTNLYPKRINKYFLRRQEIGGEYNSSYISPELVCLGHLYAQTKTGYIVFVCVSSCARWHSHCAKVAEVIKRSYFVSMIQLFGSVVFGLGETQYLIREDYRKEIPYGSQEKRQKGSMSPNPQEPPKASSQSLKFFYETLPFKTSTTFQ